jgi:hypothetical protein
MKRLTIACFLLLCAFTAFSQTTSTKSKPEDTVRNFYTWYLHRLNLKDYTPLKNRTVALHYLTPGFAQRVPRLTREMDADIIICAQDHDPTWEKNFRVEAATIEGNMATSFIHLEGKEIKEAVKMKVSLKRTNSGWRIDAVVCAE